MEIIAYQIDATSTGALVHILVLGIAADGEERLARFSVQSGLDLDSDTAGAWLDTWLTTNQATIQAAIDTGDLANDDQRATGAGKTAKQWFIDNPNARLLYTLSVDDLTAEIDALDLSALPVQTANRLKLLLKTLSVSDRVFARKLKLI